jgi:hypothetical protein
MNATTTRIVEREPWQLVEGDRFSLDGGATWHVLAVNMCYQHRMAVYADPDAPRNEDAVCDQVYYEEGQAALVEVVYARVRITYALEVDVAAYARIYHLDPIPSEVTSDLRQQMARRSPLPEIWSNLVRVVKTSKSKTELLPASQRRVLGVLTEVDHVISGSRNDPPSGTYAWGTLNALKERGYVAIEHVSGGRIARITPEGRAAVGGLSDAE